MLDNILRLEESVGDAFAASRYLQFAISAQKLKFYKNFMDIVREKQERKYENVFPFNFVVERWIFIFFFLQWTEEIRRIEDRLFDVSISSVLLKSKLVTNELFDFRDYRSREIRFKTLEAICQIVIKNGKNAKELLGNELIVRLSYIIDDVAYFDSWNYEACRNVLKSKNQLWLCIV